MRIGIGYDVHRLVKGRRLVIGGVEIPHDQGLLGHSDADVLLHAICDAMLGAAGLGDLGQHFPDSDLRFKGIDSSKLLNNCFQLIENKGFKISNIDAVVVAETPRLSGYREEMRQNIAKILGIDRGQVNVKMTTEEGLGFTGTKEGIAAWAVVLLE